MRPLWFFKAPALTSGTTSGTSGSSRKSLPLSMTIAPRLMASCASCTAAPFSPSVPAKKAKSTPSKAPGSATPTSKVSPARTALRALRARTRSSFNGNSRRLSSATSRSPTSPAPTTATMYPSRISAVLPVVLNNLVRYVEQVEDDAAPGALGPRAGPAYGEGNIRVPARAEVEDVLGAADRAKGALNGLIDQPNRHWSLPRDAGEVAEHVVLLDGQQPLGEGFIVLRQSLHKLI